MAIDPLGLNGEDRVWSPEVGAAQLGGAVSAEAEDACWTALIRAEVEKIHAEHQSLVRQVRVIRLSMRQLVVRVDQLEQGLGRASD